MPDFLHFRCPSCGKTLKVDPKYRGKTLRCHCSQKIKIPLLKSDPYEAADPQAKQPNQLAQDPLTKTIKTALEEDLVLGVLYWGGVGSSLSVFSFALIRITALLFE